MKRFFLSAAMMFALLYGNAQTKQPDSTGFQPRQLKLEEVNLVSSYYHQDGNNASVTGGIGSEKLSDIANMIDIKLTMYDRKYRKHNFDVELGIDHYTSASSDMIDLKANSSASHADTRYYPSVNWSMENDKKGTTFGAGLSFSKEFDYASVGANILFSKKTKNKNGEFTAKFQALFDQVSLVIPVELRTNSGGGGREHDDYPTSSRNTYAGSLGYSQVINRNLQVMLLADVVQQTGYLSLPFHRVYFNDGKVHQENMPDKRFKLPLGLRGSYFLGDHIIVKAYYRYYYDDWGITAHTAELELPIKFTPFISFSPFYRYYSQSATKYFAAYQEHTAADRYYTSNYDLSKFNSHFVGGNMRIAPATGVFGMKHFSMIELRYGHYMRSTNLNSDIISMNLRFK